MTVWGADAVEAAADAGGELRVDPGDLVTPLGRERAAELGVRIVPAGSDGASAAPPRRPGPGGRRPPTVDPPRGAPSGALFRRGAPLPAELASGPGPRGGSAGRAGRAGRAARVVVVGAGHVGMITALRLADADVIDEIVLVDVVDGLAAGIALDLTHTAALGGFATRISGTTTVEQAGRADYVVITAGRPRQPGMSRSDLVETNAAIVGDVAARVARTSPQAVLLVVTNPLDEMTEHAWRASGLPAERVLGMAGVLDTARFQALVALTGIGRAEHVDAVALGSHGDEMVIPLSRASAHGHPLTAQVEHGTLAGIVDRARGSGAEVVGLLKQGSAFLAPGTSAARMVLAMISDAGEVLPATVRATGGYGITDIYLGLPARLGSGGVREIVELPLTPDELYALREAADRIRERLGRLAAAS